MTWIIIGIVGFFIIGCLGHHGFGKHCSFDTHHNDGHYFAASHHEPVIHHGSYDVTYGGHHGGGHHGGHHDGHHGGHHGGHYRGHH